MFSIYITWYQIHVIIEQTSCWSTAVIDTKKSQNPDSTTAGQTTKLINHMFTETKEEKCLAAVVGFHIYTFNSLRGLSEWLL